jgi:hypothetical protein
MCYIEETQGQSREPLMQKQSQQEWLFSWEDWLVGWFVHLP